MRKKKMFSIAVLRNIPFLNCVKNHLMRVEKLFCDYMGVFAKLTFLLGVFQLAILICAI